MPELPEVETVKRGLLKLIKGKTIKKVDLLWPKTIEGDTDIILKELVGKTFLDIDRRGKFLLIRLSGNDTLVSHLRMEGKYNLVPTNTPLEKHVCVVFHLNHEVDLWYVDTRKFGRMQFIPTGLEDKLIPGIKKMGPEPTEKDLALSYMQNIMKKSKKIIKPFLLDQSNIAGLGNIYVDEILWQSKIHPKQPVNILTIDEIKILRENIISEMKKAIAYKGTTVHSYTNAFGEIGGFQNQLQVYGRVNEDCLRCGETLVKIKVFQRGTTYCPHCQTVHD